MTGKLLAALGLMTAFPLAGQAQTMSVDNAFLTSTTGTSTIAVGQTIQFEVSVQVDAGFNLIIGTMTLAGDITGALNSTLPSGWAGVVNETTGWAWEFAPAPAGDVKYPSTGTMTPAIIANPAGPGRIVANSYGFFPEDETSDGTTRLIGVVTITATTPGDYLGGAFMYPLVDIFGGVDGQIASPIQGAPFTVVDQVPALSTSNQALLGTVLATLGIVTLSMNRSSRVRRRSR